MLLNDESPNLYFLNQVNSKKTDYSAKVGYPRYGMDKRRHSLKTVTCFTKGNFDQEKEEHVTDRYIHRCPFTHCTHTNSQAPALQGVKIPMGGTDWKTKKRNDLTQGQYVSRGSVNIKVTSEDRRKAILYMITRMCKEEKLNPRQYHNLRISILALEGQVYKVSESKEKYMENLATKLFLIFKELERRKLERSKNNNKPK